MTGSDDRADEMEAQRRQAVICEAVGYLERGRRFKDLPNGVLKAAWIEAFRIFARDSRLVLDVDDLAAELRLRSLELPYDLVRPELDSILEARKADRAVPSPEPAKR